MKLYVDDFRKCPADWTLARTVTEAITILATMAVDEVSLDHDITCQNGDEFHASDEDFSPVAYYIALMNPKPVVHFHTANPGGGARMAQIIGVPYLDIYNDGPIL